MKFRQNANDNTLEKAIQRYRYIMHVTMKYSLVGSRIIFQKIIQKISIDIYNLLR